jgi:hypothetical protein
MQHTLRLSVVTNGNASNPLIKGMEPCDNLPHSQPIAGKKESASSSLKVDTKSAIKFSASINIDGNLFSGI